MSKRKFRFNIIDALIILLVLAAVGVIGYVVASEKQAPEEVKQDKKIQYVIQITELTDEFTGNIKPGETLYEVETNKKLGVVTACNSEKTYYIGTDSKKGVQVISEIDGRSNMFVTLEADASFKDNIYTVNGVSILVGTSIRFITPGLTSGAVVVSLETVG